MGFLDRFKKSQEGGIDRDVDDLRSLKARLEPLPTKYPTKTTVVGSFAQDPKELIPLICRNIDDAARALITGRDPKGNTISEAMVGKGLGNLVQATRGPRFMGGISMALNREGVEELTEAMNELAGIARRLQAGSA
jgi:hypothetical protein